MNCMEDYNMGTAAHLGSKNKTHLNGFIKAWTLGTMQMNDKRVTVATVHS